MKVLYAIQATGNGHLSRAREIVPLLQQLCDVDILVSGTQADVSFPYPIKYRYDGMSLIYNKKGALDLLKTFNQIKFKKFIHEIKSVPVEDYDLVINDFEPISAWASKFKKVPSVGLSHQAAVSNKFSPKAKRKNLIGHLVLKYFAPTQEAFGFHFKNYDANIFTPVIRSEVRNSAVENKGHYTVYLPGYSHFNLVKLLCKFKNVQWHIFSKDVLEELLIENCLIKKIENDAFIKSMAASTGVLCGGGFEAPAEALFLKKKLMVIPLMGQYEQQCNAAALKEMGVPVIKKIDKKSIPVIQQWISSDERIQVDFPNNIESIIQFVLEKYSFVYSNFPGILYGFSQPINRSLQFA